MVYSSQMRTAVGYVRRCLENEGLGRQAAIYSKHGEHDAAPDAPLVLVACSGGRDSLALACVTQIVTGMLGLRCGAVIIDHQLQKGSAQVAATAAHQCESMGLDPVLVRSVNVETSAQGEEAGARQARYDQLESCAKQLGAACVLVAHTMDDQVETVLISMARGSSPSGFAGMAGKTVRGEVVFLRPFLDLTRQETTQICQQNGIEWWDDPTNGDEAGGADLPLRSRIRQELVPVLKRVLGPAAPSHIARMAESVRQDQEYLEAVADWALERCTERTESANEGKTPAAVRRLKVDSLLQCEPTIRFRVFRKALEAAGAQPSRNHLERMNELVEKWHGQSAVRISSRFTVNRHGHVIELCQDRTHADS